MESPGLSSNSEFFIFHGNSIYIFVAEQNSLWNTCSSAGMNDQGGVVRFAWRDGVMQADQYAVKTQNIICFGTAPRRW